MNNNNNLIDVSQLRVGLYVHLDLGWMDHPFTFSNFKVKDETQISTIQKIGLKKLRYDPKRSDCEPLPIANMPTEDASVANQDEVAPPAHVDPSPIEPIPKQVRLKQLHHALEESEKKFLVSCDVVRKATNNILMTPQASIQQAALTVDDMVETALMEGDVAICPQRKSLK